MATEYQKAVAKWGLAAIGNVASVGGFGLALDLEFTGGALVVGAELASATALIGVIGGTLALSLSPVILVGLIAAIAARDDEMSRQLLEGADALDFVSAPTLGLIALSAPFLTMLPTSGFKDPFVGQKLLGSLTDFGTGVAGARSLWEGAAAAASYATTIPGVLTSYRDLQNYFSQHSSPASSQPGAPSSGTSSGVGEPYSGAFGSSGAGPHGGDLYPFSPGMGDLGVGYTGAAEDSPSSSDSGFTLTFGMSPYNPSGASGSQPNDGNGGQINDSGTGTDAGNSSTGTDPTGSSTGTDPTGTSTGTDPTGTSTGTDPTGTGTGTDPTGTETGTDSTDPFDQSSSLHTAPVANQLALRGPGLHRTSRS